MKRVELIQKLNETGCVLVRHGAKHDWSANHQDGEMQAVPCHREINEHLAKAIIKILSS